VLFVCVQAQQPDCYNLYRNKGIAAYNAGDYAKAKEYFAGALSNCTSSEVPVDNDIAKRMKQCDEKIIEVAIEKYDYVDKTGKCVKDCP
jgi:Tfp pilus assembly protein PilF